MPTNNTHFIVVGYRAGNWSDPVQVNIPLAELQAIIDARVAALAVPTTETDVSTLATEATLQDVEAKQATTNSILNNILTETGTSDTNLATIAADIATVKADVATIKADIGLIQDEFPNKDDETGCMPVIDIEHHEVHEGEHYFYVDTVELNSGASQDYLLTVPANKRIHFLYVADGSAITTVSLYEGSDKNGTTGQTIRNSDRNSGNTATLTIHKGTSGGTTDGTLIRAKKLGVAAGASVRLGLQDRSNEIILDLSAKYILRILSGTNNNLTAIEMRWYEEPA